MNGLEVNQLTLPFREKALSEYFCSKKRTKVQEYSLTQLMDVHNSEWKMEVKIYKTKDQFKKKGEQETIKKKKHTQFIYWNNLNKCQIKEEPEEKNAKQP